MRLHLCLSAALLVASLAPAGAAEVQVKVAGGAGAPGEVSCALYSGAEGFPFDASVARLARATEGDVCHFAGIPAGSYAVAVAKLPPGLKGVERDLLGRPKQPWGVSNHVRPMLRAPTFAEAAFAVGAEGVARVSVDIAP